MKSVRACATAAEGPWLLAPMHAAGLLAAVYTADEPGATAGGEPAGRNIPRVSYPPPLFTMLLVPWEQERPYRQAQQAMDQIGSPPASPGSSRS